MRWNTRIVGVGALTLTFLGAGVAPAVAADHDTLVVTPGQSIQAAIDKAHAGDTVLVKEGTYHEALLITKDGITLRGDDAVLEPPATFPSNLCILHSGGTGICVVGQAAKGVVTRYVRNDTISGLTVRSFPASGIVGFGTDGLKVSDVSASNNGGYGIARFESTRSVLTNNRTSANHEAGLYVGDSPDADTVVSDNVTWNNGFGVFVRHAHQVTVTNNRAFGNCIGVLVLDDGQPGGAGHELVVGNTVSGNNSVCPPAEGAPLLSGGGIVLVGAVSTRVLDNDVRGNNHGGSVASGGIVLASAKASLGGSDIINDTVGANDLRNNAPFDIVWDKSGHANHFNDNDCKTSTPAHLCQ